MNNNTNLCNAAAHKGDITGSYELVVYISGVTARKTLPQAYVGGDWVVGTVTLCKTHFNMANRGQALTTKARTINPTIDPTTVQEDTTMNTTNDPAEQDMLNAERDAIIASVFGDADIVLTQPKSTGIACGYKDCEIGRHASVKELKVYHGVIRSIVVTEVKCGNCRKNGVNHPYHTNTAEVKSCYATRNTQV